MKIGPAVPKTDTSTKSNTAAKAIEQETFNRKYEAQLAHYFRAEAEFEDNWVNAFGLILDNYCSCDMQVSVRELMDYEARVQDNPLELLVEVEKLMHVPHKAVHPILALIDTLMSLISLRQGKKEGSMSYLERFKSGKNVVTGLFGNKIIDGYVEKLQSYRDLSVVAADANALAVVHVEKKKKISDKFWGLMFLKQADQSKYGSLLKEYRQ